MDRIEEQERVIKALLDLADGKDAVIREQTRLIDDLKDRVDWLESERCDDPQTMITREEP